MGTLVGILLALAVIGYVGTIGAVVDFFFPEPEVAVELDPRVAELVAAHQQLSHPLPCDVWISQGMTSVTMSKPRCYMSKATREAE